MKKAIKSSLLVSTVYNTAKSFASSITSVKTPSADKFKDSLRLDENGNLLADTEIKDNIHTMMLNHPHKPSRHITEEERILKIKEGLTKLKERIIANIEGNIHHQCGENTFYYCWSGLDLSDKISTDTRIERLRDLIILLCTVKDHTVGRHNDREESEIVPDLCTGYTVSISFSKQWCVILDKLGEGVYLLKGCFISSIISSSSVFKSFGRKNQVLFKNLVAFAYYNFYVHSGKH